MANISQKPVTEEESTKGLLVRMPENLHMDLKIACIPLKMSMSEFTVNVLREAIKRAKKELGNAR